MEDDYTGDTEISIHAPLRERLSMIGLIRVATRAFQSTLPYGSDRLTQKHEFFIIDFNPRSLTGATIPNHG